MREREREKRDSDESALEWRLLSQRQSQSKVQQVLDARTSMLHVYACIEWGARKREAERGGDLRQPCVHCSNLLF